MNTYKLYVHVMPNNKKYFGITSQNVTNRWDSGNGYKSQILMFRAIQKYGWDNINHIVLLDNLSKEWACKLEQLFIFQYKTNDKKYGYNMTNGGEGITGYHLTPEQVETRRKNSTGRKHSEESKLKMSIKAKNRIISAEEKAQISKRLSDANKGKTPWNKGKKMPKEFGEKISQQTKGSKRHTQPHTEETKRKISEKCKGKKVSDETREKLRQKALEQWRRKKESEVNNYEI